MYNILDLLKSKPHNPHYLNRYYKFITSCKNDSTSYLEKHHILPKAKDMFPEYSSFRDYPWNKITLTGRQHFIAHMLLWKAYGNSQTYAFNMMLVISPDHKKRYTKVNSLIYETLKSDISKAHSKTNKNCNCWINNTLESKFINLNDLNFYLSSGWSKGRLFSKEHKQQISKSLLLTDKNKGPKNPMSDDTKSYLSSIRKGKCSRPTISVTIDEITYPSIKEAMNKTGLSYFIIKKLTKTT